jgi:large subunit ribosomal protein L22
MISQASVNFIRISPRKVRYVIDLIREKKVREAQAILSGSPRRAGEIISKLLHQAVDAAAKNSNADIQNLYISKVTADGGPTMRRFRAASMGRASIIRKRTSHIILELDLPKHLQGTVAKTAPKSKSAPAKKSADTSSAQASKKAPAKKSAKKLVGAK